MNSEKLEESVVQMKELYITYKQQYLEQTPSSYITKKSYLNDGVIKGHFQKNRTIGIRLGKGGLTKFLTFDVDYTDNLPKARNVAETIIKFLNTQYKIPFSNIQCHFSGSKGYHVTLFFDAVIQDYALVPLYNEVLSTLNLTTKEVEFRASHKYGVKLPLGIHQVTGNFMNYMTYDIKRGTISPLSEEESIEHFNNIIPLNLKNFRDTVLNNLQNNFKKTPAVITHSDGEETEEVVSSLNFEGKTAEGIRKEVIFALGNNHLTHGGSRDKITYYGTIMLKEKGYTPEETIETLSNMLINTYENPETRRFISETTTKEFMLSEVVRLTKNTYNYGYKLGNRESKDENKYVYFKKEEILEILSFKKLHLKKLLFSMLFHSKKYADDSGAFYMAYSVMTRMGNTKKRDSLRKYVNELEEAKKVRTLTGNDIPEKIHTQIDSVEFYKTKVYRVHLDSSELPSDDTIRVEAAKGITLEETTSRLLGETVTKSLLPRKQWENHFRKHYVS